MPMYNRRQSRFKRRRFNPRARLKVIKYPKKSARRQSRLPAARYGLFYDMMRKYASVNAVGKPSVAQKTMQLVTRRKNNLFSNKKMKMEGFRVTRFCLFSMRITGTATSATKDAAQYLFAGIAPPLLTSVRNWPHFATPYPATFDLHSTQAIPGFLADFGVIAIHPTWPGSKLATFNNEPQGTSLSGQPRWGVIPGNQNFQNSNYPWNTRAVENVNPVITTGTLSNDYLDILYRKIIVYKSTLTFEFFNSSIGREVDIHIVHFKIKDIDVRTTTAACYTATSFYNLLNELCFMKENSASLLDANNQSLIFEYMIQKKKLPSMNFITRSWKTITLGRCQETLTPDTAGTNRVISMPSATSNKPYRKVSFKYGMKTWMRSGCVPEGSFINDQVLMDQQKLDTQVLVFMTPNKNYCTDNLTHGAPTTASYALTTLMVNYRMWKTNTWREAN